MNWSDEFVEHLIEQGRSRNTIQAYVRMIKQYAEWFEAARSKPFEPCLFVAPDVREYRTLRQDKDSANTWNLRLASFKAFAIFAAFKGWIHTDPLQGVRPRELQAPAPKALAAHEMRDVRAELDVQINGARTEFKRDLNVRDRAIVALMAYAFLRSGEVAALDVDDVSLRDKSGDVKIRHGKGDKEATVPLGREARLALGAWLEIGPGRGSLFPGKGSERISQREIQRLVKALGVKCGLDLWPHRFRHTGLSSLHHEHGVPLATVQRLARHVRAETTLRYATASDGQMRAAVEAL
jgi:site-specific recombinase XerD